MTEANTPKRGEIL